MSVKITDNTVSIKQSFRSRSSIFLRIAAEEIVRESTKKTPKRLGNLRRDIIKEILGVSGKIVWGKNYAKYQETKQFKKYTTPGTGPHFAENAVKNITMSIGNIARKAGLI